jgi:hypothetical protein
MLQRDMASGIPIRLSATLASRARETAEVQDRSITEQVEHWARLGQMVESAVLGSTIDRLKLLSYDVRLQRALEAADTAAGRKRAARLIAKRNPVRHGTSAADPNAIETRRRKK